MTLDNLTVTELEAVAAANAGLIYTGIDGAVIRADMITESLLEREFPRNGLRLANCVVAGKIDLDFARVTQFFALFGCRVPDGISINYAHLEQGFAFNGSQLGSPNTTGFQACSAQARFCALGRSTIFAIERPINICECQIEQRLDLAGATLFGDEAGTALMAQGALIGGEVSFRVATEGRIRFTSYGLIDFSEAVVSRSFDMSGPRFSPTRSHSALSQASIGGNVRLTGSGDYAFSSKGAIILRACSVDGQVDMGEATIEVMEKSVAIAAEQISIKRGFLAASDNGHCLKTTGAIRFVNAQIGDRLDLSGSTIGSDSISVALSVDGATIGGDVRLSMSDGRRFAASGQVRLANATIGGNLQLDGAQLNVSSDKLSFIGDQMTVNGSFTMNHVHPYSFETSTGVHLIGARIGNQLELTGANLGASMGDSLVAVNSVVGAVAAFNEPKPYARSEQDAITQEVSVTIQALVGFKSAGSVLLDHCSIGTFLDMTGASLGSNHAGVSLSMDGTHVGHGVALTNRQVLGAAFYAEGTLYLAGADIGGTLDLNSARLGRAGRGPKRPVIDLTRASAAVLALPTAIFAKDSDLTVGLDAFSAKEVPSTGTVSQWIHLLGYRTLTYTATAYREYAQRLAAAGHYVEARDIRIAQYDDRRRRTAISPRSQAWQIALKVMLGYGYKPARALVALAIVLIAALTLVFVGAAPRGNPPVLLVSVSDATTGSERECGRVEKVDLALALSMPLFSFIGDHSCEVRSYPGRSALFVILAWLIQLAAWASASLSIAGYLGLVRND